MDDACSRDESVINTSESVNLAKYQYLGASGFVNAASAQPEINWTLIGSGNNPNTGDIYWGLDRFGRVDNCLWQKSTTTLAQIHYGYDRASNRTWRKDERNLGAGAQSWGQPSVARRNLGAQSWGPNLGASRPSQDG